LFTMEELENLIPTKTGEEILEENQMQ
jgi:hypothetical protein